MTVVYRCRCGHFSEEHGPLGGCAGCDAGGQSIEVIRHEYEADSDWPEERGEWCLHCGSDTCEHAIAHNRAYGTAGL